MKNKKIQMNFEKKTKINKAKEFENLNNKSILLFTRLRFCVLRQKKK